MSAAIISSVVAVPGRRALSPESPQRLFPEKGSVGWRRRTVSNGSRTHCMKVGQVHRTNSRMPGYYDGRYWTLWKLPMFGCTDSSQVLSEIGECKAAYPNAYIRLLAFDNKRQCQCMSFVIQKPNHP
uniref:Ribulose bisphosphate carboxylase small chain, chloroplastic n=1 Tax=Anthurium amnicola TaxID=1678845 RepID=A0A1D1XVC8_9ARAE